MVEKALLLALVVLALFAAASSVGGALTTTFAKLQPAQAQCAAHAEDTCNAR